MKVPKATKLPSGRYRVQVQVNGEMVSITEDDERVAIKKAVAMKADRRAAKKPRDITLGKMIDNYIEAQDGTLSPSTIAGYKRIRKNHFQELMGLNISAITNDRLQRSISKMNKTLSPKTVSNSYGLITAAFGFYWPDVRFRVRLPQKEKAAVVIPSDADVEAIISAVKGTSCELPVLLALWLGLRMSEIRGLTWDSVEGNMLHIKRAMVDEGVKAPKNFKSDRRLRLPEYIKNLIEAQPRNSLYIVPGSRRAISSRFQYWTEEKNSIQHYRFHDLRHVNASVMLELGVPDKYSMERMGHATNNMLKTVYQHTMTEKQVEVADKVDAYFSAKVHTEIHTA